MRAFLIFVILALMIVMQSCVPIRDAGEVNGAPTNDLPENYKALNYENVKAMWLSQYDLLPIYTDGGVQRAEQDFRKRIKDILENVRALGINTIFVQVRPFADSFYPSEIYPVSSYVSGGYGNGISYDPFAIILEEGHLLGLSVHAWINPLRAMREAEIVSVSDAFKIKEWYNDPTRKGRYIVSVSERWYLNPAYEEVRALVASGVSEIVRLYDVDGIHIDDYFYPTTDESFDAHSYGRYREGGGVLSLADFRRENINSLIKELYSAVKSENETVLFGVSPAGNMKNNYNELYADVALWCASEGYIDYLCPQIYFGFEHSICSFDKLCREFSEMIKADGVKLIFGMSLGKAKSGYDQYAGSGKYEWRDNKDILYRQLKYTETVENCSGVSYFSYQYFYDVLTGERVEETAAETDKLKSLLKTITWSEK